MHNISVNTDNAYIFYVHRFYWYYSIKNIISYIIGILSLNHTSKIYINVVFIYYLVKYNFRG